MKKNLLMAGLFATALAGMSFTSCSGEEVINNESNTGNGNGNEEQPEVSASRYERTGKRRCHPMGILQRPVPVRIELQPGKRRYHHFLLPGQQRESEETERRICRTPLHDLRYLREICHDHFDR